MFASALSSDCECKGSAFFHNCKTFGAFFSSKRDFFWFFATFSWISACFPLKSTSRTAKSLQECQKMLPSKRSAWQHPPATSPTPGNTRITNLRKQPTTRKRKAATKSLWNSLWRPCHHGIDALFLVLRIDGLYLLAQQVHVVLKFLHLAVHLVNEAVAALALGIEETEVVLIRLHLAPECLILPH